MDLLTNTRTKVNAVINMYELSDETLQKIVDKPKFVFDAGIDILKESQLFEEAEFFGTFENYLKLSLIEKLTFDVSVTITSQIVTGMPTLDMLLEKIEHYASEQ